MNTSSADATRPSRRTVAEQRLRRRTLVWSLRARRLDPRARRDPDFIVVGAQKAGSTSLFSYLAGHREVAQPLVKEIHYFSLYYSEGRDWYRRHFPLAPGSPTLSRKRGRSQLTGEASPLYMAHPLAMERIANDLPEVKIVSILREPVSRLLSHYRHSVRLGHETLTLDDALRSEGERLAQDLDALDRNPMHRAKEFQKFSYLTRSLYYDQVIRIQHLFPDRSMFLRLEDLTSVEGLQPLCDFLSIGFDAAAPFEAHNINAAVPEPAQGLVPDDILNTLHLDAARTCDRLGWDRWTT